MPLVAGGDQLHFRSRTCVHPTRLFIPDLQFRLAMQGVLEKISKRQSPELFNEAADGADLTDRLLRPDDDDGSPRITVGVLRASPVELEELENNVIRLRAELHEARSRNIYLSTLVEEQRQ